MCKSPWDAEVENQLANVVGTGDNDVVEEDNKYFVNQDNGAEQLNYNAITYESGVFTVEKRNCWYNTDTDLKYYLKVHTSTPSQRFTTTYGKYNGTMGTNGYASS
jgi:hypothetical protein